MDQLIELARRLGRQMAAHERTETLQAAPQVVNDDPQSADLIVQYQKQAEKIRQLEMEHKPVEVEDKHLLTEIEQKIGTNEKLKELTKRQVDFVEMMRKVRQSIDDQLQIGV